LLPAEFLALNRIAVDYPRSKTIAQLFAEQVEKSPDVVAVIAGSVQLTYRELSARSDEIASYLQKLGVNPDTLVGIATERSEYMLIAILAVSKAGGAYVPLDPDYPQARVSSMVEDSGLSLILSTTHSQSKLPATSAKVIALDQAVGDLAASFLILKDPQNSLQRKLRPSIGDRTVRVFVNCYRALMPICQPG